MLENKDYCDYDTCVALKELGFKDSTEYYYANNGEYTTTHDNWHSEYTQCWSLYEAQKWLREEKKINISPVYFFKDWGCIIKAPKYGDFIESHSSYEEALLKGIKEAIKNLKDGIGK